MPSLIRSNPLGDSFGIFDAPVKMKWDKSDIIIHLHLKEKDYGLRIYFRELFINFNDMSKRKYNGCKEWMTGVVERAKHVLHVLKSGT